MGNGGSTPWKKLPTTPWFVQTFELKGKDTWIKSSRKLEHKTPVTILKEALHFGSYNLTTGHLQVQAADGTTPVWIDWKDFDVRPFWTCSLDQIEGIFRQNHVLTRVTKAQDGFTESKDRVVPLKVGELVLCGSHRKKMEGDATCLVYRKGRGEWMGLKSTGLELVY